MSARRLPLLIAAALILAVVASPAAAHAALVSPVVVPLDRSGAVPGTINLSVTRVAAPTPTPATEAVIPLAGGPGQSALPLASTFAEALAPFLTARDLVVFDQRGTGTSGPLQCPAFGTVGPTAASDVRSCADQLGAARGFYRTIDSAEDIEAVRIAGGYDKVVLYGVSYGTKVALTYAALHPDHVAALVLDSVVPTNGPDPFTVSSFQAVRRVLSSLCAKGACRSATPSVNRDLRTLVRRLEAHPVTGTITSPTGGTVRVQLTTLGLWDVLLAGDLNPALRAEFPGAVHAALRGDQTPILRLRARAEGLTGTAPALQADDDGIDTTLFAATRCEDGPFPWARTSGSTAREREARAAVTRIPVSSLLPFDREVALDSGVLPICATWPNASPDPAVLGPLPAVPTLVLSGAADLRTPVEQARTAVATIPNVRFDVIPDTGHSVLGSDLSGCAAKALAAFAAGTPENCVPQASPFKPTRVPPRDLGAVPGRTRVTKTLNAVRETLDDVRRQLIGDAIGAGRGIGIGSRTGGLRGGVATVQGDYASMQRVVFVPGVRVSGTYGFRGTATSQLAVTGPSAVAGRLNISASGRVTGQLGGTRISIRASASSVPRRPSIPVLPHPALRLP